MAEGKALSVKLVIKGIWYEKDIFTKECYNWPVQVIYGNKFHDGLNFSSYVSSPVRL